jgi:hypothetical protein
MRRLEPRLQTRSTALPEALRYQKHCVTRSTALPEALRPRGCTGLVIKVALIALLAVSAVSIALSLILFPTPRFPRPAGSYGVGTRIYSWVDPTRPEPFTSDRADHRELVVQTWHPTNAQGLLQPYMDTSEPLQVLLERQHLRRLVRPNLVRSNIMSQSTAIAMNGSAQGREANDCLRRVASRPKGDGAVRFAQPAPAGVGSRHALHRHG